MNGHEWVWNYQHQIPGGVKEEDGSYRSTDEIYRCKWCDAELLSAAKIDPEKLKFYHEHPDGDRIEFCRKHP